MAHIGRVTSGVTVGNLIQANALQGGYGDSGISSAAVAALLANPAGTGTVTSVSVATANGLAGTVANPTTTPAITLSVNVSGLLKGNGTAISAATAGTDYQAPITLTTTGTTGAATFSGNTLNIPQYSSGGSGTVTTVGVTTANGVSGTVTNPTTTPAISLTLGAITPTSVAATGAVTGSNLSGTNTGDATAISQVLTGYASTTGTISASDTVLSAIEKLNGNAANAPTSLTTTGSSGAATLSGGVLNVPNYGSAAKVTSVTGDGTFYTNSASVNAVTLALGNAPANSVWGNATGTSAAPGYTAVPSVNSMTVANTLTVNGNAVISTNLVVSGTSANVIAVGQNGSTNPAFSVNSNTASSVTGINITSNIAGSGVAVTTTSSASNEALTISSLGTGALVISSPTGTNTLGNSNSGNVILSTATAASVLMQFGATTRDTNTGTSYSFAPAISAAAATVRFLLTPAADTTLTASTEAPFFKIATASRQHATGTVTLQRDNIIQGATHTAVAASTFTDTAALALTLPLGGTNATLTNAHGLLIQSASLTGVTNGYGINVSASTNATNNYAAKFVGPVVNGGTALVAAGGTGNGSVTPTMAGAQNGGTISFTTTGTPAASATVATVTYSSPFPTGSAVVLYPANAATALLTGASGVSVVGSTTGFTITSGTTALVTGTAYAWNYQVLGY
jgi:hypothetical protein